MLWLKKKVSEEKDNSRGQELADQPVESDRMPLPQADTWRSRLGFDLFLEVTTYPAVCDFLWGWPWAEWSLMPLPTVKSQL